MYGGCACSAGAQEAKGIGFPGTRVTGVAAVWYRCWKTNLGPLKEQYVL